MSQGRLSWLAIEGSGVGATRRCIFTTGTFVEPILDRQMEHPITWTADRVK